MIIKLIAAGIVLCVGLLFLLGMESSSDPLFLIISDNPIVVVLRMAITLGAVVVAFRGRFIYDLSQKIAGVLGACLIGAGILGTFSHTIAYGLDRYIKTYDYFVIFELGVVFLLAAASYQAGRKRLVPLRLLDRLSLFWSSTLHGTKQSKQKRAY